LLSSSRHVLALSSHHNANQRTDVHRQSKTL
jgi:hypothetical protein